MQCILYKSNCALTPITLGLLPYMRLVYSKPILIRDGSAGHITEPAILIRKWQKLLFVLSTLLLMISANVARAMDSAGELRLTVVFNNRPIEALVVLRTGQKETFVLQSNDGKMKQTPFDVTVAAGKYSLYVRADVYAGTKASPFQIHTQTKALQIEIKAGKQLGKTINIPAGELRISADTDTKNTAGMRLDISGASTFEGEMPGFNNISTTQGHLHLPVDIYVPPGSYHYQLQGSNIHRNITGNLKVIANKTLKKTLYLQDPVTGLLSIQIIKNGKPFSATDYRYTPISLKSHNGDEIIPFNGNDAHPMKLPVGVYDVILPDQAIGAAKELLTGIQIEKNRTTARTIIIPQAGTLNIKARWTHQPTDIGDCVHYYNPFNSAHLGALMGGHSVSRGKCYNDAVALAAQVSRAGQGTDNITLIKQMRSGSLTSTSLGGKIKNSEPVSSVSLAPGSYDITVWPVGNKALQKTLTNIVIKPGSVMQKELEFHWPQQTKHK